MSDALLEEGDDSTCIGEHEMSFLFARYPEINFDPETPKNDASQVGGTQSSPASLFGLEEAETSRLSDSTAHTTPLRHFEPIIDPTTDSNTLPGFLWLARRAELDEDCLNVFTLIGHRIVETSRVLCSTTGRFEDWDSISTITRNCRSLLNGIQTASTKIKEHACNVIRLKSLVAFQCCPTDEYLWSCYRQRAQLVIRHLSLPSQSEYEVVCAAGQLFNTKVYRPFMDMTERNEINPRVSRSINKLYDAVMTWREEYRQWCQHMKHLKRDYMLPLLQRISESPEVLKEIRELHRSKRVADEVINRPEALGTLPADERVIKTLNLSARKNNTASSSSRRMKTRFRREHTV